MRSGGLRLSIGMVMEFDVHVGRKLLVFVFLGVHELTCVSNRPQRPRNGLPYARRGNSNRPE